MWGVGDMYSLGVIQMQCGKCLPVLSRIFKVVFITSLSILNPLRFWLVVEVEKHHEGCFGTVNRVV